MKRRTFALTGGVALSSVAGCLGGITGPDPDVVELLATETQIVSHDGNRDGETFSVTIQNTGSSGEILTDLYWQFDADANPAETADLALSSAFEHERNQSLYFDGGERRTVTFTASPPSEAVGYYFQTQGASAGARVRNEGSGGQIRASIDYTTPTGVSAHEEKTLHISEDATKTILFDVEVDSESEFEVAVEPTD